MVSAVLLLNAVALQVLLLQNNAYQLINPEGGSIIISAPTISGNGTISANGGNGSSDGNGGGGGRIAIFATTCTFYLLKHPKNIYNFII
jgi:hypothetical protein